MSSGSVKHTKAHQGETAPKKVVERIKSEQNLGANNKESTNTQTHLATLRSGTDSHNGSLKGEQKLRGQNHLEDAMIHSYFGALPTSQFVVEYDLDFEKKTSTVLIVIDALNAKHMGAYGYQRETTPNIDKVAKGSLVFTQWVSNSSWTRPSFTTILTGAPKSVHQMELTDKKLSKRIETAAEKFQKQGYNTAAFIGNPLIQKKWRFDQGFDHFEDVEAHGDFPRGSILVNSALAWMKNNISKKPFFAVIFLTDTHAPYEAPEEGLHFSKGYSNIISAPKREVTTPLKGSEVDAIVAAYDDELLYVDKQVGKLVQGMKKLGIYNDSTIAITADHGEIFGEHNCFQHAYHMWEPVLRVPFLVRSPHIQTTGYSDRVATHVDVLPSLLHINGLESRTQYGESVFEDVRKNDHPIVSAYNARGVVRRAARRGVYKLIRYEKVNRAQFETLGKKKSLLEENPSLLIPGPRYELYNLENDKNECQNLYPGSTRATSTSKPCQGYLDHAAQSNDSNIPQTIAADELETLKKATQKNEKKRKKNNGGITPTLDDETLNALKAAGYIK